MNTITPVKTGIIIFPDASRVIVRSFIPGELKLILKIIDRALAIDEHEVVNRLAKLHEHFDSRHPDLSANWEHHYEHVRQHVESSASISAERQLYIGSLFSGEYSLESAALFNPSIVAHPDQSGVEDGALRFIMSLRATGEGHISSISFRTGLIGVDGAVSLDPRSNHAHAPDLNPNPKFRRSRFFRKLQDMNLNNPWVQRVMESLGDRFTRRELDEVLQRSCEDTQCASREVRQSLECLQWLAVVNYNVEFDSKTELGERIIFPNSPSESNGIEDARFVRFVDDDGEVTYLATYTAYNGHSILPQLLETSDFVSFRARNLNGSGVRNKGMALFPRKIGGKFAMISRQDDENLYLMVSDELRVWEEATVLRRPEESWEAVKIGNCGSPIETPEGWLLLTHGVGAMRRYCIGAILLDLEDPSRVIGHLPSPIIEPDEDLRNGYVPNVVYTCGAMIHGENLILPYGLSDSATTIVTINVKNLIKALLSNEKQKTN